MTVTEEFFLIAVVAVMLTVASVIVENIIKIRKGG